LPRARATRRDDVIEEVINDTFMVRHRMSALRSLSAMPTAASERPHANSHIASV
jgi:hypothetical protein